MDIEKFAVFFFSIFVCLFALLMLTGLAWGAAQFVGVLVLYIMLGISAGIAYYLIEYTEL